METMVANGAHQPARRSFQSQMTFLFDPDEVATRLGSLPHLAAALGDPHLEGESASAFAQARKCVREIYRVLGNAHYQNLDELLHTLESCLENGFSQPTILRTRARKSFDESLAELHAAEHFLLREYEVKGQDTAKASHSVPDFIARGHGIEVAVEVYCPRAWEGLADFFDDFKDVLKNLDLPYDYEFEVHVEQLRHFADDGRLLILHPGELAEALTPKVREEIIIDLVGDLTTKLGCAKSRLRVEHERHELNIRIWIALESIEQSRERLPIRSGVISGPSITGYAPEGMFDRLVEKNVRGKARKGQAVGHAPLSLLLVDLSYSELTRELVSPYYRAKFSEIVGKRLGQGLDGYDMIAFCNAPAWHRELQLHFQVREGCVPAEVPRLFFGEKIS
jgi:hypothetical protein